MQKKLWLQELGEDNLATLIHKAQQIDYNKSGDESYKLFRKIKALLGLNPEESSRLKSEIENLAVNDAFYQNKISVAVGAIAETSGTEAEYALIALSKNPNTIIAEQAVAGLGDHRDPTEAG